MSADLQSFAIETLVWTGALIALVLLVRRPVSHYFGAKAAYALWALPFLRLFLPPIVLPAWLQPAPETVPLMGDYALAGVATEAAALSPSMSASTPPSTLATATLTLDWTLVALTVWLAGVGVFLAVRFAYYFAMRRELLAEGEQVGMRKRVRLVETPATHSPIAFGVIDKVIALPVGFMARTQPRERELALAHELAHHRAYDLLANVAIQPLFAIHWFNPLGWIGWRAMRRDQEAACDARVVARCDASLHGTYASVIAAFATASPRSSNVALAAPMACPVLGDKSIIHRLRSLTMTDTSPRRRFTARVLMVGALAALPLTASISYAEALSAPQAPATPAAPPASPAAPAAPATPQNVYVTSDSEDGVERVVRIEREVVKDASGKRTEQSRYTINGREATPEERAKLKAELEGVRKISRESEKVRREMRVVRKRLGDDGELKKELEVLRESMGEGSDFAREMEELRRDFGEGGAFQKEMRIALAEAEATIPELHFSCDGSDQTVREHLGPDGKKVMTICRTAGLASARGAIAVARRAIARDRNLSESERAEATRALDEALKDLRAQD